QFADAAEWLARPGAVDAQDRGVRRGQQRPDDAQFAGAGAFPVLTALSAADLKSGWDSHPLFFFDAGATPWIVATSSRPAPPPWRSHRSHLPSSLPTRTSESASSALGGTARRISCG